MAETYTAFNPGAVQLGQSFVIVPPGLIPGARPIQMIWIPPGIFQMGSDSGEKGHSIREDGKFTVTLTDGFWLSSTPITVAQWDGCRVDRSSEVETEYVNYPMTKISWYDCLIFCWEIRRNWRWVFPHLEPVTYRFTLPTESQWEYTCRANTQSRFYNGEDDDSLSEIAWYDQNSNGQLHPVAQKQPNNWGLYDMLGLMYEWCLDEYTDFPGEPAINWKGYGMPHYSGSGYGFTRVHRGGSYSEPAAEARCAARRYMDPVFKIGSMRLCLSNLDYQLDL